MSYPSDFPVPLDRGGPGAGQPVGGFGGNQAVDRTAHRNVVVSIGRAPVILVHGNGGAADVRPWDLLDQRRFLLAAGYVDELIWAPSYLAAGAVDLQTPHTNNVDDVRDYLEAVCSYLDVEVVDVIAHSLGCSLMYSVCRGLDRQSTPPTWGRPKRWNRIGTFVALAGAFHGLGTGSIGEWRTGGEFMNELLAETDGGGGETPFGQGDPPTPDPHPHTISYFCGVAAGDFVDAQNPGTGRLEGAVNRSYNLGSGQQGHQEVKESQAVFDDFRPLLNSVPPLPPVTLIVEPDSGGHPAPLTVTARVEPDTAVADLLANRVTRQFVNGYLVDTVAETIEQTVPSGGSVTLVSPGVWQLTAAAGGASGPVSRTYYVGVEQLVASITTDSSVPFDTSLLVTASASDPTATLYHSLDGQTWTEGAAVTITQDAVVSFIAITADGAASEVVSATFSKRVTWEDAVTADAVGHFVAGRIDVTGYLAYSDRFGYFTPFTLYLVDGRWVLDPAQPAEVELTAEEIEAIDERAGRGRPLIKLAPDSGSSGSSGSASAGPRSLTIQAPAQDQPVTVHYTVDGTIPDSSSRSFVGSAVFERSTQNQVIACYAVADDGTANYRAFAVPGSA
jgi:hypothetical protein